jgi:YidC/Oxa1 family membrane protein insertase
MGMDRNTVIGFVLIGLLMMGMFYFNSKGNQAYLEEQKRKADSLAKTIPKKDPAAMLRDSIQAEQQRVAQSAAGFTQSLTQKEELTEVDNGVLKIVFTNKGAQPKKVTLNKYNRFDGKPLILAENDFNQFSYKINSAPGRKAETSDLLFAPAVKTVNADQSISVSFSLKDTTGKEVLHTYTLKPNDYLIDFSIQLKGGSQLLTDQQMNINWQVATPQVEKDIVFEKQQAHLCYQDDRTNDFETIGAGSGTFKFENPTNWLAIKQQFFVTGLVNKNKFTSGEAVWNVPDTNTRLLAKTQTQLKLKTSDSAGFSTASLQFYFGPSDYNVLKQYHNNMENIVPYGSGVFAFVKYINRYVLLPVFDFIQKHVASMGIVILLLTLFIRILTSPILYKSYLSGAKMKALKPEIDELKKKHGEDKQAFGMEQMKLWKSAGVNPLGGCLPALLQIPIFMSLYYFFQGNIDLRGESFLWAKDLAAYDSIYNLPFYIPAYGNHISLFTITATLTSLLISLYSMTNMQDDSNPVMKYMPYIFPILLLGVFNGLPAALTWYYTVSNTITLLLQFVIQKYIINHQKILAQIEENKKKPVKQSKLQERLLAMQETQKKVQELKNKNTKK